ncbi:hypothetical protein JE592_004426 [Salmonella enterica]|nr:hypothetical protein [Salmonella enterica]
MVTPPRPCQPAPPAQASLYGRHGLAISRQAAPALSVRLWRGQPLRVCPRTGALAGERVMTGCDGGGMVNGLKNARRESWVNVLLNK